MSLITLEDPETYFQRLAAFELSHWWSVSLWRIVEYWLDRQLKGRSDLAALDVGCGAGLTIQRLADRPEFRQVIGIEPSAEALSHRKRGAIVVAGSGLALPFSPRAFDVVTCLDVLQHLASDGVPTAMVEMLRVLRPGGYLVARSNAGAPDSLGLARLKHEAEAAGFQTLVATHVNCVGSIAQELRGRLAPRNHRSHPSGGGLPNVGRRGLGIRALSRIARFEADIVGRWGWPLPFGHSTMLLARRPSDS